MERKEIEKLMAQKYGYSDIVNEVCAFVSAAEDAAIERQKKASYAAATRFIDEVQPLVSGPMMKAMSRIRHICFSTTAEVLK